jgi:hypothetical protein
MLSAKVISSIIAVSVLLVTISFAIWSVFHFWSIAQNTLDCNSPEALRLDAEKRCSVFGAYFVISFLGFVVIAVVKALLLFGDRFHDGGLSLLAFGTARSDTLIDRFGYSSVLIGFICLFCVYQYLRSIHHRQMLYALHRYLGDK